MNASVLYTHIARKVAQKENNNRTLKNRARVDVRDNLVVKMSMPWMRAAGLVLKKPDQHGMDVVDQPVVRSVNNSRAVYIPQEYRETSV
ncbi:Uncharacterised protein [Chlamydia abortus]|nr:Uncharacterised protein [Chlamydia abortus]SGA00894.1 Uncharacterised protein [Chlamydia abortus]SGA10215.1 Uncharacterised protein [Chlamydia abortus]SGA16457.1 Uncharacterised protein [Chlamydia abortus]SGA23319.1 Uncharacterised protein [Chlamydia abortus]